jgi:hypothetical protein
MAIEKNTFPYKGLEIEVSSGDERTPATIIFEQHGVTKEYHIDGNKSSKNGQEVIVYYNKFIKDADGNVLNQDTAQSFVATKQESADYFYNIPADKIGLKTDLMSVNGLLYELFQVICYSPADGKFYPPITADVETTKVTFTDEEVGDRELIEARKLLDPSYVVMTHRTPNNDGTITVTPVDIIGTPSYELMGTDETNDTGLFENLPVGTYHIKVTSDAAEMPLVITANIEGEQ